MCTLFISKLAAESDSAIRFAKKLFPNPISPLQNQSFGFFPVIFQLVRTSQLRPISWMNLENFSKKNDLQHQELKYTVTKLFWRPIYEYKVKSYEYTKIFKYERFVG